MAVNKYDRAAEAAFINTYAPIDFGALYQIGAANNAAVEKALKELSSQIKEWAQFSSPFAKDNARWQLLTLDRGKDIIQRFAENPELMKTVAGRAELLSFINNTDYAALNRLKQSAEFGKTYQLTMAKLAAEGKMPDGWEPNYYESWDTLGGSGIFNKNPLPYVSINDLVHDYVNDLKDGYIKSKDGYLLYGVTPEQTEAQINAKESEILARPEAQRMINNAIYSGIAPEVAIESFLKQAKTAAREKARITRYEADPYSLARYKHNLDYSDDAPNNVDTFTQAVAVAGYRNDVLSREEYFAKYNSEKYKELVARIGGNNKTDAEAAKNELKEELQKINSKDAMFDAFATASGYTKEKDTNGYSGYDINKLAGVEYMRNHYGIPVTEKQHEIYGSTLPGITETTTELGKLRTVNNTRGMRLEMAYYETLDGVQQNRTNSSAKIDDAVKNGKLGKGIYAGGVCVLSIPTERHGKKSEENKHIAYYSFNANEAAANGITAEDVRNVGGSVTRSKVNITHTNYKNVTENLKHKAKKNNDTNTLQRLNLIEEAMKNGDPYGPGWDDNVLKLRQIQETYNVGTSETESGGIVMYTLPLIYDGAYTGGGLSAEGVNQETLKNNMTGKQSGDLYSNVQKQAHLQ